jgi:hypothetical protein
MNECQDQSGSIELVRNNKVACIDGGNRSHEQCKSGAADAKGVGGGCEACGSTDRRHAGSKCIHNP